MFKFYFRTILRDMRNYLHIIGEAEKDSRSLERNSISNLPVSIGNVGDFYRGGGGGGITYQIHLVVWKGNYKSKVKWRQTPEYR